MIASSYWFCPQDFPSSNLSKPQKHRKTSLKHRQIDTQQIRVSVNQRISKSITHYLAKYIPKIRSISIEFKFPVLPYLPGGLGILSPNAPSSLARVETLATLLGYGACPAPAPPPCAARKSSMSALVTNGKFCVPFVFGLGPLAVFMRPDSCGCDCDCGAGWYLARLS